MPSFGDDYDYRQTRVHVWTGVYCDYSDGMAFAIANSKREAIEAIAKADGKSYEVTRMELAKGNYKSHATPLGQRAKPIAYISPGGG